MKHARSVWALLASTLAFLAAASPAWAQPPVQVPAPPALGLVAVGAMGLAAWTIWRRRK